MLTRQTIITQIANDTEIKSLCKKLSPKLSDDLFQELIVILLEYDEQKIIDIYGRNQLKFFIVKILLNMTRGNRSPFVKKFTYTHQTCTSAIEYKYTLMQNDFFNQQLEDDTISVIELYSTKNRSCWYRTELFKQYLQAGSLRELSKRTKIPTNSICRSLNEFKLDIKQMLNEYSVNTTI